LVPSYKPPILLFVVMRSMVWFHKQTFSDLN